jgi:hypothetical protein
MARWERICRILRDLGIFLMGVAAIAVAADYLFHPDPMRDMQRAMTKSFVEGLERPHKQSDAGTHSDNRSKLAPAPSSSDK